MFALSKIKRPTKIKLLLFSSGICCAVAATRACGPWLPNRLLDNGGKIILDAPEFYFEIEAKRIAQKFRGPFKAVNAPQKNDERKRGETLSADLEDFNDALKHKAMELHGLDESVAWSQHVEARDFIEARRREIAAHEFLREPLLNFTGSDIVPEEIASEFADYHRGALAFYRSQLDQARAAWTALLARPAGQRHYRSTWAAFMLGTISEKPEDARKWFSQVRAFTKDGFADTLGLAARSFSREAAARDDDLNAAAQLCLEGLASGDRESFNVLQSIVEGVLDDEATMKTAATASPLREVVSTFILARTADTSRIFNPEWRRDAIAPKWLSAIERAHVAKLDEADVLGWTAYSIGKSDEAARWLKRAPVDSGLSLWLKAKLDFRAGKTAEATATMAKAVRKIPRADLQERKILTDESLPFEAASGDLAMLRLSRGEFVAALHSFLQGDFWQDAAYVAERVLSVEELRNYVQREYPRPGAREPEFKPGHLSYLDFCDDAPDEFGNEARPPAEVFDNATRMRYLLARRLVRLGRYREARPFFPSALQPQLDHYQRALESARSGSALQRGLALWNAAKIAHSSGMELMGTEVEPDAAVWSGQYPVQSVATARFRGAYLPDDFVDSGWEPDKSQKPRAVILPVSAAERARLAQNAVQPERRFHYRYVAADLAWRAAQLMPDNSEETADVLNTAGRWLKNRDEKAADRFYQAIERRCPKTEIGKAAIQIHWFPDLHGPLSDSPPGATATP